MTIYDDRDIIHKVTNGDSNAFAHIVRRYQKMVLTIVLKILNDFAEAEDVTQEIFIKTYESLDKYRDESQFSTWLYRIAYNTTITHLRKQKNKPAKFEDIETYICNDEINDAIYDLEKEERLTHLDMALKKLPQEDALMITMFYMNDHSVKEISIITGHSEANVKVKLHRIRKIINIEINKLMQL